MSEHKILMVVTVEAALSMSEEHIADIIYDRLWDSNQGTVEVTALDVKKKETT